VGAMPPSWQYFSRRQSDDIGNLEQPEARLDQPVALHAAATAAAREGLAVRIDGWPRALLQFDRDLESFPPEVLLRLRKACADATGVLLAVLEYALSGRTWTDSGRTTHAGSKDRGVATVRTRPRRPHDVVSLVHSMREVNMNSLEPRAERGPMRR
jgi:hypothetical protein